MSLAHPERLDGCDPDLVRLVNAVAMTRDVVVIQGARSLEEEQRAIASGHSALRNPMDSKHVTDPIMRPLFYDYPDSLKSDCDKAMSFTLGPSLMVAGRWPPWNSSTGARSSGVRCSTSFPAAFSAARIASPRLSLV